MNMHEEIKDEIRSVVRPNFKSQINGQNLQDVLIDMVEDYGEDLQDIRDTYATTASLQDVSSSLEEHINLVSSSLKDSIDLVSSSLDDKIDLVSSSLDGRISGAENGIQDVRDTYATTASLTGLSESISSTFSQYATVDSLNQVSSSLDEKINSSGFATTTSLALLSESVNSSISDLSSSVGTISSSLDEKIDQTISGSGFATTESLNQLSSSVAQDFANLVIPDISGLATTASVNSLSSSLHSELAEKATTASLTQLSESVASDFANLDIPDVSGLASTASVLSLSQSVNTMSASFDQRIDAITGSGGSGSCYWEKSGDFLNVSNDIHRIHLGPSTDMCNVGPNPGAIAEGYQTYASASYSHTFGRFTKTTNPYEVALGLHNDPQPGQLFSVGVGEAIDYGRSGNAISVINHGVFSPDFEPSASVYILGVGDYNGYNPVPGTNDVATIITRLINGETEGLWHPDTGTMAVRQLTASVASGEGAIAEGWNTTASGKYSHAEGDRTVASGEATHAEGKQTSASYYYSHAEGYHTRASGNSAHAEGFSTTASADYSHAEGDETVAAGPASHAEGLNTIASNSCEHACGRFNATSSNQIFSVGVGHSWQSAENPEIRRNAVSIITPAQAQSNNSASIYIQGIGGYNGTNPVSGSNDLATAFSTVSASANQASASVAGLSRETWTFVMTDSSSVSLSLLVG